MTGGCGFIGSHLVDALLADGHNVRVLDDLSTGNRENILLDRIELVLGVSDPPNSAPRHDWSRWLLPPGRHRLRSAFKRRLGARPSRQSHRQHCGIRRSARDQGRKCRPRRLCSSAAVYGDNPNVPLTEDATTRPLTAYGADKLGSEQHARVAGNVHGVATTGFRFFNVYGPRQDPLSPYSGVISIFANRLAAGEPVTIFGDGEQTRDFVYVADVVRHLIAGMQKAAVSCTGLQRLHGSQNRCSDPGNNHCGTSADQAGYSVRRPSPRRYHALSRQP